MLSWRKNSADISDDEPTFQVRYIGTTETYIPNGNGCTTQPLQRLWDNAPSEKNLRKVTIKISLRGIYMSELENKSDNDSSERWFNMEDVSFCAADTNVNDRLFCWINKDPISGKLQVHAVLCNTRDKAQAMATILSRAFQVAYKNWIAERQREKRKKATNSVNLLECSSGSKDSGDVPSSNIEPMPYSRKGSAPSKNMTKITDKQINTDKQPD